MIIITTILLFKYNKNSFYCLAEFISTRLFTIAYMVIPATL